MNLEERPEDERFSEVASGLEGQNEQEAEEISASCSEKAEDTSESTETSQPIVPEAPAPESLEAELEELVAEQNARQSESVEAPVEKTEQLEQQVSELTDELARRNADLYNLQQEYSGYVKRSRTELANARQMAAQDVVESLLPALDEIEIARKHGDLEEGPFRVISEKIEGILEQKYDLERFGTPGEVFDPQQHEALMATTEDGVEVPTIKEIVQPGYRLGDRVVRPARVLVANPAE